MNHLSFDLERMEAAHDLWRWRVAERAQSPDRYIQPACLGKEMERRGLSLEDGWRKEYPRPIAHELILLSDADFSGFPTFDPSDPNLSDYEAARIATIGVSSSYHAAVGERRHLSAHRSGEYAALLGAVEELPVHFRGFIRGEILRTIAEREEDAVFRLKNDPSSRPLLGYDLEQLRREAVLGHQESLANGIPWMLEDVVSQLLRLLSEGEDVVSDLITLAKRIALENLSSDPRLLMEILSGIFRRYNLPREGFELMQWLMENGKPEVSQLLTGSLFKAYPHFSPRAMPIEEQQATRKALLARSKSLLGEHEYALR